AAWTLWGSALIGVAGLVVLDHARWAWVPLLVGVAALGGARATELPPPPEHVARMSLPRDARVSGRVVREPTRYAPDRVRLLLDVENVDGERRSGRLQASIYGPAPPLVEGQRVSLEARLHAASGFRNPGGFDYAAALQRADVAVVATARSERVTPLEAAAP